MVTQSSAEPLTTPLFPGGAPAQPISSQQLTGRLRRVGIHPRAARSTAFMDLAGKLPAAVLSRMLGIHVNSAARWG